MEIRIFFLLMLFSFGEILSQTVDASYLDPQFVDADYKYLRFGNVSTFYAGFMWNDKDDLYGDGDDFSIFTYNNRDITFRPGSGNVIFFPRSGGNIGIGTANPLQKLEVKGKIYLNSGPDDDGIYWARHNMTLGTIPGSYNHNVLMLKPGGATNGLLHSSLEMYIANSENSHEQRVKIHSSGNSFFNGGNVGIGTASPDAKLAVKGKIHAEEVKVDLSVPGPDYVFKEGYDLKSLEEVKNYIKEHGHLPNIPSAKEMEEDGVQLGEMNMKLLEKIEELTLYILEQDEKIKEMEILKAKLIRLEKMVLDNKNTNR